ncbi:uncharacterized protein [Antennarius striatus]|uniref:uncharacterized protein n=1 Tax=Antennarius striatus TaxID=241820 RepID=UPI0035AEABCD
MPLFSFAIGYICHVIKQCGHICEYKYVVSHLQLSVSFSFSTFNMSIPVIDFGAYSLKEEDVSEDDMQNLSEQLRKAFTEVGFVFLENTGISQEEVDRVLEISKKFFLQQEELKQPFIRENFSNNYKHGWLSFQYESLNPLQPADLKESFNFSSLRPDIKRPSGAIADFQEILSAFFLRCKDLGLRVLTVMAHSLDLDPEVFLSAHQFVGTDENGTTLRPLYYPPVKREGVKKGQLRCGEHSDYGTITLLFQKNEGLQVCRRSGEFIDVPVIPGAVLINIADVMQRWTSDCFISARHRVLLPPAGDTEARQSVAFFLHPDDDALIKCLDGSNKYPPITGRAYGMERLYATTIRR